MSEINEINIPNVVIPKFGTNEVWLNGVPFVPSNHPSVTTQIGFPIVEILVVSRCTRTIRIRLQVYLLIRT